LFSIKRAANEYSNSHSYNDIGKYNCKFAEFDITYRTQGKQIVLSKGMLLWLN